MNAPRNLAQENLLARQLIVAGAQKIKQEIYSQTVDPESNSVLNVAPRNVGLILGFIVEVEGVVFNAAGAQLDRTEFGSANILRNITYTDLNNTQRINTTGAHLAVVNSARQGFGMGGAYAPNLPMGYGNNWGVFQGAASIAASAEGTVRHTYWVPLAYSSNDLRGSIYSAIVNATQNLALSINTDPCVANAPGANPLNAIYEGNAGGGWKDTVKVTVTQVYYDQLPQAQGGMPFLPYEDLNVIYDIKNVTLNGLTVGQDFPIPYANFRQFLSTMPIFDNGGVFNAGSDVNYWAMQAANSMNLFRIGPNLAAFEARQTFMADPPKGVYYFDHRDKPVDTITFGNMELVLNASQVNAGARLIVGYEAFQKVSQIGAAGSLPGG